MTRLAPALMVAAILVASLAGPARAGLTITLSNPNQTVARPPSGATTVTFAGTVGVSSSESHTQIQLQYLSDPTAVTLLPPSSSTLGAGTLLNTAAIASALAAGGSFTGDLFSFQVHSNEVPTLYDRDGSWILPAFYKITTRRQTGSVWGFPIYSYDADAVHFSIRVTTGVTTAAVPEPGPMVMGAGAGSVGLIALVRRRSRRAA